MRQPLRTSVSLLGSLASFSAGFALVALLLGRALPPLYSTWAEPKLRYLEQHRGEYDLLVWGSSRVYRHFIPAEFDQQLAACGHPLRSFNFGVDAMSPPESFYLLRRLLAQRPGVRWIVVELWEIRTVATENSLTQQRFVNWHDLRHTAIVLRRLLAEPGLPAGERFSRGLIHLRATFVRCSQFGRGAELLGPVLKPPKANAPAYEEPTPWRARQGFFAGASAVISGNKREAYEKAVARMRASFPTQPLSPQLRAQAAALAREIRASGAEPIFLVMPTVLAAENYAELRPQGVPAAMLSLVSAERFPALYETALHNDDWHLTETGAHAFNRYFAGEFCALLDAPR